MLASRGSRSSGRAVTPSVGDQRGRRDVTSTRQPPVGGLQAPRSCSSSQLSNTNSRGTSRCHASLTRCTRSSTGMCVKSASSPSAPEPANAATWSGISFALAKLSLNTPPREEAPVPMHQLDCELRLAQPTEARGSHDLAERHDAADLEGDGEAAQLVAATDE